MSEKTELIGIRRFRRFSLIKTMHRAEPPNRKRPQIIHHNRRGDPLGRPISTTTNQRRGIPRFAGTCPKRFIHEETRRQEIVGTTDGHRLQKKALFSCL
jgi:hypothetical protein